MSAANAAGALAAAEIPNSRTVPGPVDRQAPEQPPPPISRERRAAFRMARPGPTSSIRSGRARPTPPPTAHRDSPAGARARQSSIHESPWPRWPPAPARPIRWRNRPAPRWQARRAPTPHCPCMARAPSARRPGARTTARQVGRRAHSRRGIEERARPFLASAMKACTSLTCTAPLAYMTYGVSMTLDTGASGLIGLSIRIDTRTG